MSASRAELLQVAHEAVYEAQRVTRMVQRDLAALSPIEKGDASPVTIADYAAQAVINRTLRERLGPQRVLAEEHSAHLRDPARTRLLLSAVVAARIAWPEATGEEFLAAVDAGVLDPRAAPGPEPYWTLDPIDGTRGFIRGHQYSICLALIERGRVVVAALACPNLSSDLDRPFADPDPRGLTFLATDERGVLVAPADVDPLHAALEPLPPAPPRDPARPLRLCGSYAATRTSDSAAAEVIARLHERGVVVAPPQRLDSQVKYAVVARGQMDAFLRMPRSADHEENVWDHAPGSLIARRAGVVVTDCLGRELNYAGGARLAGNRGLLIARPEVHARLLPDVRAVVGEAAEPGSG